ncbi:hypothetical protein HHL22_22160 [Hymenobacter sp. RP-2-7]|uniref:Protein argonaute n=1 Tax=Hymenobacter polaris TaxID=2682546 RepID=A0A7Y0AII2_9BACT|nr:Piwi domain-containing protein [Hymenobacter polaris]NML67914.1 hypothetical protein [Hymenobacter polaris]
MSFLLNIAPLRWENTTLEAECFDYDENRFRDLRDQHQGTHLVKRKGSRILCVALQSGLAPIGGQLEQVELAHNLSLVASLASEALYRQLPAEQCRLTRMRPLSYLAIRSNLLQECLPANVTPQPGLAVFAQWELDFRVYEPTEQAAFVGMSVNVRTTPRISLTCAKLLALGVPLQGFYVGQPVANRHPALPPRFTTLGRVAGVAVQQGVPMLQLEDVRGESATIVAADKLFLEPRGDVLEHCIRHLYGAQATSVLAALQQQTADFHVGPGKLRRLQRALTTFRAMSLELVPGLPFEIEPFWGDQAAGAASVVPQRAPAPTFVFAPGGQKVDVWADQGLRRYGPYSRESFTPARLRLCVICQASKKGQVEQAVRKFLDGIPRTADIKAGQEYTGLKAKFHLQSCAIEFFLAADDSAEAYSRATSEALRHLGSNSHERWNLALVQIDRAFRTRTPNANPYLITKARFIGQQIPVQEFALETMTISDSRLTWVLNNMSLATYAKLNGIPWLLKADLPIAHEMVFGIGSAIVSEGRFGNRERMIGITTVFTGDGNYFVSNVSSAVPADEYFPTLLASLRETMRSVQRDLNWQPRDTVRLIFHAFKEFRNAEAEAVKQVMQELGDYQVEFAFLHVAPDHPFVFFDTKQSGFGYYNKGPYAPERGQYLALSRWQTLVSLTGVREVKQSSDGLPAPVQLRLHRDSTFTDMTYLARQIVNFAAHSWRGFHASPMPVTVAYSQQVAQLLGQLAGVSYWNPDAMLNRIGTTRWFL